jgi:hypothetical protein
MAIPKYRLTLVFASGGPRAEEDLLAAEELLREELWTGLIAGHEKASAQLFVITPFPQRCLDDISRRLLWLDMVPASASFEPLMEVKPGDFQPGGQAEPLSVAAPPQIQAAEKTICPPTRQRHADTGACWRERIPLS